MTCQGQEAISVLTADSGIWLVGKRRNMRTVESIDRINNMLDLYYNNVSTAEIAKIYNIKRQTVCKELKMAGYTARWPPKEKCHCGFNVYKNNMCIYHYEKTYGI